MANNRSDKQTQILQYIYDKQLEKGYPPTVREIAAGVGLSSTSTVHGHLTRLIRKGLLTKDATKTRALEVTDDGMTYLGVRFGVSELPVLDNQLEVDAAGELTTRPIDTFPIPESLLQFEGDLFMVRLQGEDMKRIGMLAGDQVIVRRQNTAMNGEIVVLSNDNQQLTVRRFFQEADHYRLQPENDRMAPEIVTTVNILGRVVGLYRDSIY
jgi:repressor LexA